MALNFVDIMKCSYETSSITGIGLTIVADGVHPMRDSDLIQKLEGGDW